MWPGSQPMMQMTPIVLIASTTSTIQAKISRPDMFLRTIRLSYLASGSRILRCAQDDTVGVVLRSAPMQKNRVILSAAKDLTPSYRSRLGRYAESLRFAQDDGG